nr:type I restriction endonuclease [Oceanospirillum sediminis]
MIDWNNSEANDFAIAEEASIKRENKKRSDLVLYVNGIALGIIELIVEQGIEALIILPKISVKIQKQWLKPSKIMCVKPSWMKIR